MKREGYQNRRIIDLFAAKLHNSPIYYIALYRGFNTEKQKGKMKGKMKFPWDKKNHAQENVNSQAEVTFV